MMKMSSGYQLRSPRLLLVCICLVAIPLALQTGVMIIRGDFFEALRYAGIAGSFVFLLYLHYRFPTRIAAIVLGILILLVGISALAVMAFIYLLYNSPHAGIGDHIPAIAVFVCIGLLLGLIFHALRVTKASSEVVG